MWWVCKLFCKPGMSRIVDHDRGRSVLMSGIVWCYLESPVTTSVRRSIPDNFFWAIRDRAENAAQVTREAWREQMIPTESESRARFVNRGNNEGWALRSKSILDICYGCSYNSLGVFIWHLLSWLLGRRFILWQTIPGDILSPGERRVSGCQPHTLDIAAH